MTCDKTHNYSVMRVFGKKLTLCAQLRFRYNDTFFEFQILYGLWRITNTTPNAKLNMNIK